MRRGDRKTESSANELNHPHSRKPEPMSAEESKQLLMTLRAQKQDLQGQVIEKEKLVEEKARLAEEKAKEAEKTHHLYLEVKKQEQSYLTQIEQVRRLAQEKEDERKEAYHLYLSEQ